MAETKPSTMLTVRIPDGLMDRITAAAQRRGQTRSEFLRDALTAAASSLDGPVSVLVSVHSDDGPDIAIGATGSAVHPTCQTGEEHHHGS